MSCVHDDVPVVNKLCGKRNELCVFANQKSRQRWFAHDNLRPICLRVLNLQPTQFCVSKWRIFIVSSHILIVSVGEKISNCSWFKCKRSVKRLKSKFLLYQPILCELGTEVTLQSFNIWLNNDNQNKENDVSTYPKSSTRFPYYFQWQQLRSFLRWYLVAVQFLWHVRCVVGSIRKRLVKKSRFYYVSKYAKSALRQAVSAFH